MLSDREKGCGEGNETQTRTCTNGNIENCVDAFEVRQIHLPCSVPCNIVAVNARNYISPSSSFSSVSSGRHWQFGPDTEEA